MFKFSISICLSPSGLSGGSITWDGAEHEHCSEEVHVLSQGPDLLARHYVSGGVKESTLVGLGIQIKTGVDEGGHLLFQEKGRTALQQCLLCCSGGYRVRLWSLQVWLLVSHSPARALCLLV